MVFIKGKKTALPNISIHLDSCYVSNGQGRITSRGRILETHSMWFWLFRHLLL